MVSIKQLRRNISEDKSKSKFILYYNKLSKKEFFVEAKNNQELQANIAFLELKKWCSRIRVSTSKPLRAERAF